MLLHSLCCFTHYAASITHYAASITYYAASTTLSGMSHGDRVSNSRQSESKGAEQSDICSGKEAHLPFEFRLCDSTDGDFVLDVTPLTYKHTGELNRKKSQQCESSITTETAM